MLMNNINENINKDERALEALLAAAFKLAFPDKISDEQAVKFFQQPPHLSQEDKETIDSWGTDFVEKLIKGEKTELSKYEQDPHVNEELELEISAMNRDKNGSDVDDETRRKIEEERKKTLEEEKDKKDKQNES
jgi:hypothetical protein